MLQVWKLAIPMTLNNLAGGIAGGVVGIGPTLAGGSAFVASFVMMAVGYVLGKCVGGALDGRLDVRLLSCAIFAFLCVSQVEDKLRAFWAAHVHVWWRRHGTSATVLAVAAVGALVACWLTRRRRNGRAGVRHMSGGDHALALERCRALMRLRGSLGVHYAGRKERLLSELVLALDVERGAAALGELRRIGFVETEEELARWVDQLLVADGQAAAAATDARKALLAPRGSSDGRGASSCCGGRGAATATRSGAVSTTSDGVGKEGGTPRRSPWPRARLFGGGGGAGNDDGLI